MRKPIRIVLSVVLALAVLALAACGWALATANARYNRHWNIHTAQFPIPFPLDPGDPALAGAPGAADSVATARAVERGAHLVNARVGCMGCHGPDLAGAVLIEAPVLGYWAAPNLTAGRGGITRGFGAREWDMAVRHGVRHTGLSSSMPCGEFVTLSDRELSDIVAYVRSLPPVDREIAPPRFGPVFAFLLALDPKSLPAYVIDHRVAHAAEPPPEAVTPEFGRHIAQVCTGCHGEHFSGGKVQGDPNMPLVANLTPHETGLKAWTEADFVRAMRLGRRPDDSAIAEAMPWRVYGQMTDTELAAVWTYLRTLPPRPKGNH
jgi:mono/diheme cytochrome c family protein